MSRETYRLMLLNWCSPAPAFNVIVISKVRLADIAPPTLDITMTDILSKEIYVAGFGTNMKLLSRQNRCPSLALMLHLTPDCWWWLWKSALDLERDLEQYTWRSPWMEWQLSSLISRERLGQRQNAVEIHNERAICPYTFPLIIPCTVVSILLDFLFSF